MRHKPRNIALLSVLVMLVVGVTASAASAAFEPTKFEWKVGGSPLASGASKEFTAKDKGSGLFKLKISAAGATVTLTSSKIKVHSGAKIVGGKPGAAEETLELENVKVAAPLENCGVQEQDAGPFHGEVGKITTVPLKAEIVEGASGGEGIYQAELLLTPKTGTIWTEFKLTGACALSGLEPTIEGSLLAEPKPQKTEATIGNFIFESKVKGYKVSPGTGAEKTAKLEFAKSPATLTGEAEMELVSKEAFGAF
jgi:hypothetical protein